MYFTPTEFEKYQNMGLSFGERQINVDQAVSGGSDMSRAKVIDFEAREQLLQNAQIYLQSVELFLEERDKAVPLLLKAMRHGDREMKHEDNASSRQFCQAGSVMALVRDNGRPK